MSFMGRLKGPSSLAFVIGISALIFSLLPLRTAFEMGDDEGYEVIKGFMCSKGFKLYTEIWNDQPPVSTMILRKAFELWGPSIFIARLVAAGFGLVLLAAFHELVRKRSGHWTAMLATFFLLASPGVLILCVSVMLEVPAFATALVSAWLLFEWGKRRHWVWLVASGAVMALALQIKLTAALILPAIMIELLFLSWPTVKAKPATVNARVTGKKGRKPNIIEPQSNASSQDDFWKTLLKQITARMVLWGLSMVLVFATIGLTWGKGALASSWKSHTSSQVVAGLDRVEDHKFDPRLLRNHFECAVAAAVCLLAAFQQKRMREVSFPLALLVTAAMIHTVHRPWWNYYYLHLAIPLAWLAGWAVSEAVKVVFRLQS